MITYLNTVVIKTLQIHHKTNQIIAIKSLILHCKLHQIVIVKTLQIHDSSKCLKSININYHASCEQLSYSIQVNR